MEKGCLLGKGATAEVYQWGEDKVLKLYLEGYKDEWVRYEAEVTKQVHEAGVPSPAVFDMVEADGRRGVIFEKIPGKTMTDILEEEPWRFFGFLLQTARLQAQIHRFSSEALPTQKEKFAKCIAISAGKLGDKAGKILEYVDRLPDGNSICHGDMYLSNIIITHDKPVAIDWTSGYRGDPAGDVARTCLIINSKAVLPGMPEILGSMAAFPKWCSYQTYLNEYIRITKMDFDRIDAWILPVAAAKLKDRIPGEEKWLMDIINKRLKQLKM